MKNRKHKTLFLIIAIISQSVEAVDILDFKMNDKNSSVFSTATLKTSNAVTLPDHFILCSSHVQKRINASTHSIFVLYEDESLTRRWLTLGLWEDGFWLDLNDNSWIKFPPLPHTQLRTWISLCLEVNTGLHAFKMSVNGGTASERKSDNELKRFYPLYLQLGITENSWYTERFQFVGQIRFIRIFNGSILMKYSLEELSLNSSPHDDNAAILSWNTAKWNLQGETVSWVSTENESMYLETIKLPTKMSFSGSKESCSKFKGHIADVSQIGDAAALDTMAAGDPFGFWLPYSDAEQEAVFANIYTGRQIR